MQMQPIVDGLEAEFTEGIVFQRLDAAVPDNERLQLQFGVRGHPSVVILDERGQVASVFVGPQDAAVLREAITAVLPTSQ
jgi:thioredoxin-like negative regulator of GroEL